MEREIEIAGHWLIFLLIFGMVMSMAGMAGWIIGHAYSDPSQAAAHWVLHPLARVSVIVGPIVLFIGAAMFLGSIYGIHQRQNAPAPALAPIRYKGFRPLPYNSLDEKEAEEEITERGIGLRRSFYGQSPENQGMSNNA